MARTWTKSALLLTRTLHIYATMLSLILLIFFAFSGFVMNHGEWFNLDTPKVVDRSVTVPTELTGRKDAGAQLAVVEFLRKSEKAQGEVASYDEQEESIRVQFKGAGTKEEFAINRADGKTEVHEEWGNALAVLGELHKGKGTGEGWRRVIDAASLFLLFAALSGVVLWLALPKRRMLGIVSLVAGVGLCVGVWWWLVP